jgi:hypothetical protein
MITGHRLKKNRGLRGKIRVLLEVAESCAGGGYGRAGEGLIRDGSHGGGISPQRLGGSVVEVIHGQIDDFSPIALGHRGALLGESVERCPVFLCGNFEKRLHIIGGVPACTPVGGDARDQDVSRVSVIDLVGQRLGLDSAFGHSTIVPSTCSFGGQSPLR